MKLVMTLLVRDEEDVLAGNLEFHLQQGVDFFIITDNLSVDGTRDIIESYVRAGVARYLHESDDRFAQSKWVTRMARLAATEHGAEWVINSDADELWRSSERNKPLKNILESTPADIQAIYVNRFNFIPVDYTPRPNPLVRMTLRERESRTLFGMPIPPKVAHRAAAQIMVTQGNHAVLLPERNVTTAPGHLNIFHYPLRSYAQFENKIKKGGAAYERNTELPSSTGATWRTLYREWQAGALPSFFKQQMRSPAEVKSAIEAGELLVDTTVAELLSAPTTKQESSDR